MFLVVKPQLEKLVPAYERARRLTPNILAVVVVGFLLSAFITSEIGIHLIFGALIFGAVMPREGSSELNREILERLEQISLLILLPVFFIVTGLGVDVTGLGATGAWQRFSFDRGLHRQVRRRLRGRESAALRQPGVRRLGVLMTMVSPSW